MSNTQQRLNIMLRNLYNINTQLGGNLKAQQIKNTKNDFESFKNLMLTQLYNIKRLQEQRDMKVTKYKSRDNEIISLQNQIDTSIQKLQELYFKLQHQFQSKQNKLTAEEKDYQQNIILNFKDQIDVCLLQEQLVQKKLNGNFEENFETLTDQKELIYEELINGNVNFQKNDPKRQTQFTEEEKLKVQEWDQRIQQQDQKLDMLIDQLDRIQFKVDDINDKIEITGVKIEKLSRDVDKVNVKMMNQNQRLKKIITQYRKPSRFFMDLILILLLIAMAGILYKQLT